MIPATEKQINFLRNKLGWWIFISEEEVLLREEIMIRLKLKDMSIREASRYIARCVKLPERSYISKEQRCASKPGMIFRARPVTTGRVVLSRFRKPVKRVRVNPKDLIFETHKLKMNRRE